MKRMVNKKNGYCDSISVECTMVEALVMNHALQRYINDEEIRESDKEIAKQMLDVDTTIRELPPEGEWVRNIHDKTICNVCGTEKTQWYDNYCSYCGADMRKER